MEILESKKIKKGDFYKNENLFKIDEMDANKILISIKELYGAKYMVN